MTAAEFTAEGHIFQYSLPVCLSVIKLHRGAEWCYHSHRNRNINECVVFCLLKTTSIKKREDKKQE